MQENRNLSIDLVKIVAMFGVMCLHSTHSFAIPNHFCFADVLYESAVVSMPLFFMVSGYLLIGRPNVNYRYSIRKIIGIVRFVSIIVFAYWMILSIYQRNFDFAELVWSLIQPYFQSGKFSIFWYFGAMIIIYVLYPNLNNMYIKMPYLYHIVLATTILCSYTMFIGNIVWGGGNGHLCK